jgi:hypothetical protein
VRQRHRNNTSLNQSDLFKQCLLRRGDISWSIYLRVLFETNVPARSHLEGRDKLSGMEEAEKLHFLTFSFFSPFL